MCLFCKIINGEIPAFKLYETKHTLAFLDIGAATKGHTLVIPKKHVENLFELSHEDAMEVMSAVLAVTKILQSKLQVTDMNLLNNSGGMAGQTVMHFHMHLIPRYENDGIKFGTSNHEPDFAALAKLHEYLIQK